MSGSLCLLVSLRKRDSKIVRSFINVVCRHTWHTWFAGYCVYPRRRCHNLPRWVRKAPEYLSSQKKKGSFINGCTWLQVELNSVLSVKKINWGTVTGVLKWSWNKFGEVHIKCLGSNTFLFEFLSTEGAHRALSEGPWSIDGYWLRV